MPPAPRVARRRDAAAGRPLEVGRIWQRRDRRQARLLPAHGGPEAGGDSDPLEHGTGVVTELLFPATATASDIREIERTCDRFEAAWFEVAAKGGRRPSLECFLDQSASRLQPTLLCHLLALEWEYRLRAGDRPRAA